MPKKRKKTRKPRAPSGVVLRRAAEKLLDEGAVEARLAELAVLFRHEARVAATADDRRKAMAREKQVLVELRHIQTDLHEVGETQRLIRLLKENKALAEEQQGSAQRASMATPLSYPPDPRAPTH